jgi:recombination protein RecR
MSSPIDRLIEELGKLPGIGRRTAERLADHILKMDARDADSLVEAIEQVKAHTRICSVCFNLSERDPCPICDDPSRDAGLICVVEDTADLRAFEKAGGYRGLYHVLGGRLSPLKGIGPEDLTVEALLTRVRAGGVEEVILATNPDVDGDATALFLGRELEPTGVNVTRIGLGVPVGGNLEYADQRTLQKALQSRQKV